MRVTDFARIKAFYQDLPGFPMVLETPELVGSLVGSIFLGFKQAAPLHPLDTTFTPFNTGLDHLGNGLHRRERAAPRG